MCILLMLALLASGNGEFHHSLNDWSSKTLAWLSNSACLLAYVLYPPPLACDHALSPFLSQITCKKARMLTFFWLDRKQYRWFALFRLAKMPPSVSCCWFQSAFLLACNTHASSLWNFCRLSFLEFEECLNRNFIHWNIFHLIVY